MTSSTAVEPTAAAVAAQQPAAVAKTSSTSGSSKQDSMDGGDGHPFEQPRPASGTLQRMDSSGLAEKLNALRSRINTAAEIAAKKTELFERPPSSSRAPLRSFEEELERLKV